jgi:hypothetical protein
MHDMTYTPAQLADLALFERGIGFDVAGLAVLEAAACRLTESGLPAGKPVRRILRQMATLFRDLSDELEDDLRAAARQEVPLEEVPF